MKSLLRKSFGKNRALSRHFLHAQPSRFTDLSPYDFCFRELHEIASLPRSTDINRHAKDKMQRQFFTLIKDILSSAVQTLFLGYSYY